MSEKDKKDEGNRDKKEEEVKDSIVDALFEELEANPHSLMKLASLFGSVLAPWEALATNGAISTEYHRKTVQGNVVAIIKRDFPTWKVEVDGKHIPSIHREIGIRNKPEDVMPFVNKMLYKLDYILPQDDIDEFREKHPDRK